MTESSALPMFPLQTVLFPHVMLPLHVFEPRYRELTRVCLEGDGEFGVVLIRQGSEVGGGDVRFDVGTAARIAEASQFPDGRWALVTVGVRRLRVRRWLPDDPYPIAEVEPLPDASLSRFDSHLLERAEKGVRRALALRSELDEGPAIPFDVELARDAEVAIWQLCALAPLGPLDKQRLLEQPGPVDRLRRLGELVEEECEVLALRLGQGIEGPSE